MSVDHSLTYKNNKLRNLPHKIRLKAIINQLDNMQFGHKYCDVGCSNGYLTNLIALKFDLSDTTGLDHNLENLSSARENYPDIKFDTIDLNIVKNFTEKYELLTCFETLEHVGDLENALENLLRLSSNGGIILISVPIEVGFIGLLKFFIKTIFFRYSLNEINRKRESYFYFKYLFSLIFNKNISKFRDKIDGYGTHFGFDYRDIEKWLVYKNIAYCIQRKGTTIFYTIKR